MKYNPNIDFILIHISDSLSDFMMIQQLKKKLSIKNFKILKFNFYSFNKLISNKLNITINVNESWYYKMNDFKPTLGYLFSHILENYPQESFWGYCDMDIIWGNVTRFSYWFQGDYPIVITGED
jgi:hypothetical protein